MIVTVSEMIVTVPGMIVTVSVIIFTVSEYQIVTVIGKSLSLVSVWTLWRVRVSDYLGLEQRFTFLISRSWSCYGIEALVSSHSCLILGTFLGLGLCFANRTVVPWFSVSVLSQYKVWLPQFKVWLSQYQAWLSQNQISWLPQNYTSWLYSIRYACPRIRYYGFHSIWYHWHKIRYFYC